jgi:hypothetical protein
MCDLYSFILPNTKFGIILAAGNLKFKIFRADYLSLDWKRFKEKCVENALVEYDDLAAVKLLPDRFEKLFQIAIRKNELKIFKYLLHKIDPSYKDNWAIRWASEHGRVEIVRILLADKRVNPAADNNLAIKAAEHVEIVRMLLADKRVNPAADNNRAIREASRCGHVDVVSLLLADKRVNPADCNNYAIKWAHFNNYYEVVQLLKKDERVNPENLNPFSGYF